MSAPYASGFEPRYRDVPCPVCGAEARTPWRMLRGAPTSRCDACGHIYAFPMPTEETLLRAYALPPDEYRRFFNVEGFDVEQYERGAHAWQHAYAASYVQTMDRLRPERGRLLEIGCSSGLVLEAAQGAGWQTAGVDPAALASRGPEVDGKLGIRRCSLFEAGFAPRSFDLVFGASLLEHLAEPRRYLDKIAELLKPGGRLIVAALPNIRSFTIRLGVDKYIGNHPPGHLQFFSKRTASALLERAGFQVDGVRIFGMPETVIELLFGDPAPPAWVHGPAQAGKVPAWRAAAQRVTDWTRQGVYKAFDVLEAGSVMEVHASKPAH